MPSLQADSTVRTTCPYCGVGCQMQLQIAQGQIYRVEAPFDAAPNYGNLCVKGRFGLDFATHPRRLRTPLIRAGEPGNFREASWDEALDFTSQRLSRLVTEHGGDSIATYACAKATNEDNFVFQKWVRAVLGTNNIDHCARLCHAGSVTGLQLAIGSSAMSNSIAEMENLDTFIVTGSNTTETHPVISLFLKKAVRKNGAKLIVIDPRQIELTDFAALWLRQKPGTDVAVFQAMAHVIVSEKLFNPNFIEARTEGFEDYIESLEHCSPEWAEQISGVPADDIRRAARMYATAERAAFYWGMGISQSTHGTDNALSLTNLALMCGHAGKPGTGLNPLRGQNNVQGCSDSGGLPNVFTAYQSVADPVIRGKFEAEWRASLNPAPGLTVTEMVDAALLGKIKAMVVMGENPMMSEPNLSHAQHALEALDLLVCIDIFMNETGEMADVILPSASFAEKDGTFTNSDRRVQRVRQALPAVGESLPDWQIICALATRMEKQLGVEASAGFDAQLLFHARCQRADDLPVGQRFAHRGQCLAHPLHAPVAVGEGAVFLGKAGGRQDDIRHLAGFIHKDIDADQQVQRFQGVLRMREVGLAHHGVFAHDDHSFDLPQERGIDHFGHGQAGRGVEAGAPFGFKLAANDGVGDRLIGGEDIGQAATIAAALYIILPAQGVQPGAWFPGMTAHQGQVGQRQGVVCAMRALADAHAPIEGGALGGSVHTRGAANIIGGHATDLLRPFRAAMLQRLNVVFEALGARFDEIGIEELLADDDMRHRLENRHIGAWLLSQPQGSEVGQLNLTRVNDDKLGAVFAHSLLQEQADDRVRFGGVAAGDDEGIQVFHLGDAVAHGAGADGQLQACNAAGMAEARAMIDIVGAQDRPHPFLKDKIVFVGGFGAGVGGDAVAAMLRNEARKSLAGEIQRFVPTGFAEVARLASADERRAQAARVGSEIQPEAAFHAEIAIIRRGVKRRFNAINLPLRDLQLHLAANAAIRASRANGGISLK